MMGYTVRSMGYERLQSRLTEGIDCREVIALPDGSVDRYATVANASGEQIPTQDALADRIASGARSLRLLPDEARPGGQAVNAAKQVHALGQSVRLYGHLDNPELGPFPFPAVSMGTPATVHVLAFEREELMLSVESSDIRDWTVDDLFDAASVAPDEWIDDAVLVVQNWVGFPEMTAALDTLAEIDLGPGPIVFDPGDISDVSIKSLQSLARGLSTLAESITTVITANDQELDQLAAALSVDADETDRERCIRNKLGVEAVVRHAETCSVAATAESVAVVENFDAREVARRTGAGDRFDGGLATALAADLSWDASLALGNACATHFVETGTTATRTDVLDLLDTRVE